MKRYFFVLYLLASLPLMAQTRKKTFRIPNNSDITKTIPARDRYLFENFRKGTVYFRNGNKSDAQLNYSFFHSEIQFISPKNDTLLLADNDFVRRIVIDDLLFYYWPQRGHVQQVRDFNKIRLCKKQQLVTTDKERDSAYGGSSSTSSISSYSTYTDGRGHIQPLNSAGNVIMGKSTSYFWMDQNDRFHPASKANLIKIFPGHFEEINNYFKDNTVNFSDEQDLVKLLEYCQSF